MLVSLLIGLNFLCVMELSFEIRDGIVEWVEKDESRVFGEWYELELILVVELWNDDGVLDEYI